MASTKASFDFFSLPPELRNRIYEDVLVQSTPPSPLFNDAPAIIVRKLGQICSRPPDDADLFQWPALLSVNKQIRREATPVFLGQNTFLARFSALWHDKPKSWDDSLYRWLDMLGSERAKMIKKEFVLDFDGDRYQELIDLVRGGRWWRKLIVGKRDVLKALCVGGEKEAFGVEDKVFRVFFGERHYPEGERKVLELLNDGSSKGVWVKGEDEEDGFGDIFD